MDNSDDQPRTSAGKYSTRGRRDSGPALSKITPDPALAWGRAGSFPGMPDLGSVSATLSNGGSVMVSPDPNNGKVEVIYFTPNGGAVILVTDAGSIKAGQALVARKVDDLLALNWDEQRR